MIVNIPLDRIAANPWQTRQGIDPEHVKALAEDIAQNGLLQTPVGRMISQDDLVMEPEDVRQALMWLEFDPSRDLVRVQLAFGHNRLAAFRYLADFSEDYAALPVEIRPLSDEQMADFAWSENEKRRDHSPVERALAIQKRIEDFGWTQVQVAEHLGISRPVVGNALRLLKLPEGVRQALASGAISERVAMALAGLFDLPEFLRERAEREGGTAYGEFFRTKPSQIVRDALAGNLTSDQVREGIQRICSGFGKDLAKANWGLEDAITAVGVQATVCKECERRLKERNLCMDGGCYAIKQTVVKDRYLQQASQACGIQVFENYQAANYGHPDVSKFDDYSMKREGHVTKIVGSGCENLRLIYSERYNNPNQKDVVADEPNCVTGFPNAMIVCQKREGYCTCIKAMKATRVVDSGYDPETKSWKQTVTPTEIQVSEQPTADELQNAAAQAKELRRDALRYSKEIVKYVGEMIGAALRSNSRKAWKKLAAEVHYQCGQEESNVTDIQDAIGREFATKALPYEFKSPLDVERAMAKVLEAFGAEINPAMDAHFPATSAQYQERMARLKAESDAIAAQCQAEGKTLVELFAEEEAQQ